MVLHQCWRLTPKRPIVCHRFPPKLINASPWPIVPALHHSASAVSSCCRCLGNAQRASAPVCQNGEEDGGERSQRLWDRCVNSSRQPLTRASFPACRARRLGEQRASLLLHVLASLLGRASEQSIQPPNLNASRFRDVNKTPVASWAASPHTLALREVLIKRARGTLTPKVPLHVACTFNARAPEEVESRCSPCVC